MAKPSKQFCGTEHWSGEPCKVCDGLKARRSLPPSAKPRPRLVETSEPVPCLACAVNVAINAALNAKLVEVEAELETWRAKAERERAALLLRVRKSREAKAARKAQER